jgi:hypothetical protein
MACDHAAIVPAVNLERARPHPDAGQFIRQAEAMKDTRAIWTDLDPGADLAQRRRLFYQESRDENKCYCDSKLHNVCCPAFIHQGEPTLMGN